MLIIVHVVQIECEQFQSFDTLIIVGGRVEDDLLDGVKVVVNLKEAVRPFKKYNDFLGKTFVVFALKVFSERSFLQFFIAKVLLGVMVVSAEIAHLNELFFLNGIIFPVGLRLLSERLAIAKRAYKSVLIVLFADGRTA